jgi:small conductance mechanosensitive channel
MDYSLQSLDQVRASALDMAVRFGPKLVIALIIIAAGDMVGRWVGRILNHLLLRLNFEAPVRSLLVRIARVLVLGLFAIMALQNLGVELLPLIAGLGVAGAGSALAVSPWVTLPDSVPAGSKLNRAILETFRTHGIVIPLPQREVRMLGVSA